MIPERQQLNAYTSDAIIAEPPIRIGDDAIRLLSPYNVFDFPYTVDSCRLILTEAMANEANEFLNQHPNMLIATADNAPNAQLVIIPRSAAIPLLVDYRKNVFFIEEKSVASIKSDIAQLSDNVLNRIIWSPSGLKEVHALFKLLDIPFESTGGMKYAIVNFIPQLDKPYTVLTICDDDESSQVCDQKYSQKELADIKSWLDVWIFDNRDNLVVKYNIESGYATIPFNVPGIRLSVLSKCTPIDRDAGADSDVVFLHETTSDNIEDKPDKTVNTDEPEDNTNRPTEEDDTNHFVPYPVKRRSTEEEDTNRPDEEEDDTNRPTEEDIGAIIKCEDDETLRPDDDTATMCEEEYNSTAKRQRIDK